MISDRGKRTNSLAFAQSDCYTCASLGDKCDRRRPRCSTCLGQARRCSGFATRLLWDPRRMVNSPSSSSSVVCSDSSKQFRFVKGATRPKKRRKEYATAPEDLPAAELALGKDLEISDEYHSLAGFEPQEGFVFDDFALFDSILTDISPLPDNEPQDTLASDISRVPTAAMLGELMDLQNRASMLEGATEPSDLNTQGSAELPHLRNDTRISQVTSPDHGELLELYDSEYCVLPLTGDIPGAVNPFRCDRQTSGLLFHAILALCCHHHLGCLAGSSEAAEHRKKAVQLLECALKSRPVLSLLDPILILFTLDCTLSAAGTWSTHLMRAYSMLQALGGSNVLTTPRMRAQVGMLIWWDATLALISRQSPIIDQTYLDFLIGWERHDEWSFFDLTGCPRNLLVHLVQLAELAKQSGIASSMKWLTFNMAPVTQIEYQLIQWNNNADAPQGDNDSYLTEEEAIKQTHEQQDRYHCAEAWRHALLLYIQTIFKRNSNKCSTNLYRLVRKAIDSIRCCRRTSLIQKQLLIPVFLAGSETSDEEMRCFVKEYCAYWGEKSRYNMFNSVSVLFDEIWASGKWWGDVIDSKAKPSSDDENEATQLLFG